MFMTQIYLLTDQHNNYLDKEGNWIPAAQARSSFKTLFHTSMKDEAINQKVEYIVKNPEMRIMLATAGFDDEGMLVLEHDEALA